MPDGTLTEVRQSDNNGNLASLTHFNGVTAASTYDDLNRLSTVVDSRLGTTTCAYDPASNVATVTYPKLPA